MGSSESKLKGKTKATGRTKKPVTTVKSGTAKKITAAKSLPGENEIRIKAQEIFNERIFKGEHGTAEADWLKAEKLLGVKKK